MIMNKEFYRMKTINTTMTEDPMQFNLQITLLLEAFIVMQVFLYNVMARGIISQEVALKPQSRKGIRKRDELVHNSIPTPLRSSRFYGVNTMRDELPKKRDKGKIMKKTTLKHTTMPKRRPATDIMNEGMLALPKSGNFSIRIREVKKKKIGPSFTGLDSSVREVEAVFKGYMQYMGLWLEFFKRIGLVLGKFDPRLSMGWNREMIEEEQNQICRMLKSGFDRIDNVINDNKSEVLTTVDSMSGTFDFNLLAAKGLITTLNDVGSEWLKTLSKNTCLTEPNTISSTPTDIDSTTTNSAVVSNSATNPTVKVPAATVSTSGVAGYCEFLNSSTNNLVDLIDKVPISTSIIDVDDNLVEDLRVNYCNLGNTIYQFKNDLLLRNGALNVEKSTYQSFNNFGKPDLCYFVPPEIRGLPYNPQIHGGEVQLGMGLSMSVLFLHLLVIFGGLSIISCIVVCGIEGLVCLKQIFHRPKGFTINNPEVRELNTKDSLVATKVTSEPKDDN